MQFFRLFFVAPILFMIHHENEPIPHDLSDIHLVQSVKGLRSILEKHTGIKISMLNPTFC